ncbi:MAG TPA: alpha/beta hydrolase [Thermoanaerobaculia bacterium]|nr:alpha/beta hydrolase [Thermoanaerobaculia bacterium]
MMKAKVWAILAAAGLAAPLSGAPPAASRLSLATCKVSGVQREVRCGRMEVWEDRARKAGRKISLRIVVLPATGSDRAPDPVFLLAGGPGESAVEAAAGAAAGNAEINKKRDIVLVDVRGTGDSNGLQCPSLQGHQGVLGFLDSFLPVAGVRECRRFLEPRANLALYTTTNAMDDLDDVRAALGYQRVNLEGGSFGTFAALVYMRRHPEHVRTAVLEGVVPPGTKAPLHFARNAQTALDQVIAACGKDAGCRAAFPDVRGDVDRVLARLEAKAVEVTIKDPKTGEPRKIVLGRNAAAQTIRYMLYLPITAAQIPLQVHLAAQGDYSRLVEEAYLFGNLATSISDGFFLSATCSEDVPFFTPAEAEAEAKGTFLGDFRTRVQKAACAEWPRGEVPPDFDQPVKSGAPALLISGERDPATPSADAESAAKHLRHAKRVVIPGAGHDYEGERGAEECIGRITTALIEKGTESGLDTSCVPAIVPVPFALKDDREAEVKLSDADLDRFAGSYVGPDGHEFVVRRRGAVLQFVLGEGREFVLTPIAPARFRIEGAPPGYFVEFQRDGESVTGIQLEEGPTERETLKRKP